MKDYRNVLHFADYGSPYKGNFIASLETLEKKLLEKNHQMFYLFPLRTSKREWAFQKENTYFLTGNFIKDLKLINKIVKKNNIDIIHIHFYSFRTLLLFKCVKFSSKIIIHLHGMSEKENGIKKYYKSKFFKHVNIIGCSKTVTNSFPYKEKVDSIKTIRNAIYFPRLEKYEKNIKELKSTTSIKILIFGYNYYVKGVDISLEAINKAREKYPNIDCFVSISSNKQEFKQKVIERFGEFPSWIKILPPRDDIASYYCNCDIFISASRSEGFCYALVEAAYTGCNIIASNIPAQKENNVKGILWFEKENVEDLKDRILDCIYNKEKYKKEIISQKEIIKQRYDINEWAREIIQQYEAL